MPKSNKSDPRLLRKMAKSPQNYRVEDMVKVLVYFSRRFKADRKKMARCFSTQWLPACTLLQKLVEEDLGLWFQLTLEDVIALTSTTMGEGNEQLYASLEILVAGMSLEDQFELFDKTMKLSRRWRREKYVYQYLLLYLLNNFNVPAQKGGAVALIEMISKAFPVPDPPNKARVSPEPDDLLIALRQTFAILVN